MLFCNGFLSILVPKHSRTSAENVIVVFQKTTLDETGWVEKFVEGMTQRFEIRFNTRLSQQVCDFLNVPLFNLISNNYPSIDYCHISSKLLHLVRV